MLIPQFYIHLIKLLIHIAAENILIITHLASLFSNLFWIGSVPNNRTSISHQFRHQFRTNLCKVFSEYIGKLKGNTGSGFF